MRRTKRNRFWHMGILFLIYSCLHVYSATIGDLSTSQNEPLSEPLDDTSPNPSYLGNEFYQTTDKTDEVAIDAHVRSCPYNYLFLFIPLRKQLTKEQLQRNHQSIRVQLCVHCERTVHRRLLNNSQSH